MAQTEERARSSNGSVAPAKQNTGAPATDGAPKRRFDFSRLLMPRIAQSGPDGKPAPRQRSGLSKLLFGFLILLVVSQILEIILAVANQNLKLGLFNYVTKDHNAFIIGGLTWFSLIYFSLLIGLYVVLLRFNILPKDPFGTKAQARERAAQTRAAGQSPTLAPGQTRTRAARREAARTAAAAPPPSGKTKKVVAKPQPQPEPARKPPARAVGAHDEVYERVKAQQRQQRRRDAKR
jgi:hypothetical protein